MCVPDGMLRARLDGELSEPEVGRVAAHLETCPRCRERAEAIAARAGRVGTLFSELRPGETPADAVAALARLDRRATGTGSATWIGRLFGGRLAPAWGAAVAVLVVAVLAGSAPGRVFAQKMLGLLRVNAVVAVPIERNYDLQGKSGALQQLLSDSVVKTKEGRHVAAANRDDAGRLAGYDVRLPEMRQDAPVLAVNTENAVQFTANSQRLETLLSALGRTDLQLPPNLDGAKVIVDVPPSVEARYGECPGETCLVLVQTPSPTIVTMPELDLRAIAEFGLQLAGMTAQQASTFSQTIDWTSTLAIPIPTDVAGYETVTVNGAKGILVTEVTGRRTKLPPGYALLWAKNGMIYSLSGFGNPSLAVPLAESLR
jgi:Putative zinc-finger